MSRVAVAVCAPGAEKRLLHVISLENLDLLETRRHRLILICLHGLHLLLMRFVLADAHPAALLKLALPIVDVRHVSSAIFSNWQ